MDEERACAPSITIVLPDVLFSDDICAAIESMLDAKYKSDYIPCNIYHTHGPKVIVDSTGDLDNERITDDVVKVILSVIM